MSMIGNKFEKEGKSQSNKYFKPSINDQNIDTKELYSAKFNTNIFEWGAIGVIVNIHWEYTLS